MGIQHYEIVQVRLDGVPKIPYKDGVGKHRGVCMHATANYGVGELEDTAMAERNWEQSHWEDAFVHYFCDYQTILDVADDDYISYGCSGGNPYFVNIELCQTKRDDRFIESYNRWIYMAAKVLFQNKLGVKDGETLVSHRWVSQNYGGTHDDPHAYIESHGKTWADVVADVTKIYEWLVSESEDEDGMALKLENWGWQQVYNILGKAYNDGKIDWVWCQKVLDRTLTAGEYTHILAVVDARDKGIDVDAPNDAVKSPEERNK